MKQLPSGMLTKQSNNMGSRIQEAIFQSVGQNQPIFMDQKLDAFIKEGYQGNADVFSVIDRIGKTASTINWTMSEVVDQKALIAYKSMGDHDPIRAEAYKTKALKEIDSHEVLDLLKKPNPTQGYTEFINAFIGFKLTTGNGLINGVAPDFGRNKGLFQELWVMPSHLIDVIAGDFRDPIKGYEFKSSFSKSLQVSAENVLHSRYFNPDYELARNVWGLSPIQAAYRNVTSSNSADTARVRAFQNQGAVGMISGDAKTEDMIMSPDEMTDLEERYREKFGGVDNFNKVLFTMANVKWWNMGLSPVDLAILDSKMADMRTICNIFHAPSVLFNDVENSTYNNLKEARKSFMTDAVMPIMNDLRDELNIWLVEPYSKRDGKKYFLSPDWKNVPALQEDLKMLVETLKEAWWLTPNQRLKIQGAAESTDPNMSKIWMPNDLVPMEAQAGIQVNKLPGV